MKTVEKITVSPTQHNIHLDMDNLREIVLDLRALNHNIRQQILALLQQEGSLTVTEIYLRLRLDQSVTSQHLAMLRRAQIVQQRRQGKIINYTVNTDKLNALLQFIQQSNFIA